MSEPQDRHRTQPKLPWGLRKTPSTMASVASVANGFPLMITRSASSGESTLRPRGAPTLSHDFRGPSGSLATALEGDVGKGGPISCSHLTGCLPLCSGGSGHVSLLNSLRCPSPDMPATRSGPKAHPRMQARTCPPSSGGILRMVSVCQLHARGSSSPRVWGAPLSVMLREYFPASPRPHGKRDQQKCKQRCPQGQQRLEPMCSPSAPLWLTPKPAL